MRLTLTTNLALRSLALAIATGLAGCTTIQVDLPPLQAELPAALDAVPAEGQAGQDLSRWWEGFNDPVLTGYIEEGLRSNTDIRVALARVREARAYLGVSASTLYPAGDLLASGSRGKQTTALPSAGTLGAPLPLPVGTPSLATPGESIPWSNTHGAALSVAWEVDIFGARRSENEMVRQLVMGAQEQTHGAQLLLASDLASRYFEARGAERRLALLDEGIRVAQRLHRYAQGRFKAGQTTATDVDRAELELRHAESQVEPLKALLHSHLKRIAVLMGKPPESLKALPPRTEAHLVPPTLPAVLPGEVLERRPDVRGAARKLRSQAAKLGSAKADLLPKFYIGMAGLAGRLHPDHAEGRNFDLQQLGVGLRLPLFDAGRIRSNIAANQAQLEGLAAQYEQAVLTALEDVENAYTAQRSFQARHELMVRTAELARRVAVDKESLFKNGQELLQPVLEAQAQALTREDEAIQGDVSRLLYTVTLYKALGGGWSAREGEMGEQARAR